MTKRFPRAASLTPQNFYSSIQTGWLDPTRPNLRIQGGPSSSYIPRHLPYLVNSPVEALPTSQDKASTGNDSGFEA